MSDARLEGADRATVQQLRQSGADLAQARQIRHYLYFPTRDVATQAAGALQTLGYGSQVREGADKATWLALAEGAVVVNDANIARMRTQLTELAAILKGEYDGWEAAPTP